jgi:quercetin dioxygenase-like cupin family protein
MSAIMLLPGEGKSVTLGPNSIGVVFKLYSEDTGGQFAIVEHPIPPGTLAHPHLHHNEDEYSYVLEGEVAFQLGEKVLYGKPGTLIAKPRNIWHTFWNQSASPARILEIISPGGFERFFEELAGLSADGRMSGTEPRLLLAKKYNLEFDRSRIPELVRKYNLKFPGAPDQK